MGSTLSCRRSSSYGQESENAAACLEAIMDDNSDFESSGLHSFMADLAMAELNSSQRSRFAQRREARRAQREAAAAAAAETRIHIVMPEDPADDSDGPPPSPLEVINQLPKVKASKVDGSKKPCGVCCEKYKISDTLTKLPCGHSFHSSCIEEWLLRHCTCPMCRFEIGTKK